MQAETVRPGQWLRHLTNNPSRPWRLLEEIVDDPFARPGMVVLKFANGDGLRLHTRNLSLVVDNEITGRPQIMWTVSNEEPREGVATGRTTSQWLTAGTLTEVAERSQDGETWLEARLEGYHGNFLIEIPAEVRDYFGDDLAVGAQVEAITPALSSGVPGVTEVRVAGRTWKSADGIPVSIGFLESHGLIDEAGDQCSIVAHAQI